MEKKIDENTILEIIINEPIISQRRLSEKMGISLGMVNILIKRCIKKGFLKVENLNSRTVKYILTPKGINEKTKKTLNYIKYSYRLIFELIQGVENYLNLNCSPDELIFLFGKNDEIMDLLETTIIKNRCKYYKTDLISEIKFKKPKFIFVWSLDYEEKLISEKMKYINIIKLYQGRVKYEKK